MRVIQTGWVSILWGTIEAATRGTAEITASNPKTTSGWRVGKRKLEGACPPEKISALPLSPTLKSDGGNDAADAAVVALTPPSFFLLSCRFPVRMVVLLDAARRTDDEAKLCTGWVVKTIWESTQMRKCDSLVAACFNQRGPHLGQSRNYIYWKSCWSYKQTV